MDYRYLKAFLLTAQHESFSKAADSLKIAQSAVSRQIKLLEESVGEELIIRSSKKVILTDKGNALYMAAQHFDKLSHEIFDKEDDRPVRVGILHGLLKNWFIPRLGKFFKKGSRAFEVNVGTQKELRQGIEEGKFDVIFSSENIQSELISSLKLFDERLVLISRENVNKKKLQDYRWIVYSEEDNIYKLSKKLPEQIISVKDIHSIVDLVKAHVGIAVVPDHVLKKTDALVVQDITGLDQAEIFMTTLNYKNMPASLRELSELVQK
ncbi:MAG: LysR family transcriptional regulator [Halobacteriovoraceae bacterium]|nr:LysR family transcriptional regulator [Halobacteriovoraceae bacterium]